MADEEESKGTTEETKETEETKATEAKDATADKETEETETVADKHDQPGVNREKYQRDLKARDDEIATLKAQISKASETAESRTALETKIDVLEKKMAGEKTDYELKLAGIKDEKAAKAAKSLLADYDGDVSKLKADCDYLFEEETAKGSTGVKPGGPGKKSGLDAKIDAIFDSR